MSLAVPLAAGGAAVVAVAAVVLFTTERPPMESIQRGYRGVAMQEIYNPRFLAEERAANTIPASLPRLPDVGPKASAVYKNVKVLGDESVGNFTRLMASITTWVAPTQGCAYCHDVNNMASDAQYTKVVARRMIQMVQHVNSGWKSHVAETGVTCYTCHRGQPVPANIWFHNPGGAHASGFAATNNGMGHPSAVNGTTGLPGDPFSPLLEGDVASGAIRVEATEALPSGLGASIQTTEQTYALMIHMSESLGVNCTFCHNTRQFASWDQSTPQRVTAWHGIRLARTLNDTYLSPLTELFPPNRLGPLGDGPKVNCATCHQGVNKPLYGVSLAKDYPELGGTPAP
jgi:photosynthetic reaction center cytochrome c subunit